MAEPVPKAVGSVREISDELRGSIGVGVRINRFPKDNSYLRISTKFMRAEKDDI